MCPSHFFILVVAKRQALHHSTNSFSFLPRNSGAQSTIISKACAERCNILRLLDTRFSGMAHGVGSAKIYGRIHLALLTLGTEVFEVSFTVMDAVGGSYDMLLGLDMLRKHQACIDLDHNCLRIGSSTVTFLAEKDIPKTMLSAGREAQPEAASGEGNAVNGTGNAANASGSEAKSSRSVAKASSTAGDTNSSTVNGRASAAGSASAAPPSENSAVHRLVEMGFGRAEVEEALQVCSNDAEQAAALLMSQKYGL